MKIEDQFRVDVPVEETWKVLLDVERIAPCMPGAQLQEIEGDEYRGIVKVKVGPITAQYKGAARIVETDEAAHKVVLKAEGRDTRGQGNASGHRHRHARADGRGTVVKIDTDLNVTGKVAQFGRGVMADVSGKLLGQFADNLQRDVLSGNGASDAASTASATADETATAGAPASAPRERRHRAVERAHDRRSRSRAGRPAGRASSDAVVKRVAADRRRARRAAHVAVALEAPQAPAAAGLTGVRADRRSGSPAPQHGCRRIEPVFGDRRSCSASTPACRAAATAWCGREGARFDGRRLRGDPHAARRRVARPAGSPVA